MTAKKVKERFGIKEDTMVHSCRWCVFCFVGEVPFCNEFEKELSEVSAKRRNKCKHFSFIHFDAFEEIAYDPERGKRKHKARFKQIKLF